MSTPQEPRWLTPDERDGWVALAGALMTVPAALDAQMQRDAKLSYFEYMVLSWLSMQPERTARMSDLAEMVHGSLSRLSHGARRLEKQGLLARRPDPADGRYTLATLTGPGWDKVAAAAPGHVEAVRRVVLDPLTKTQIRQLCDIGTRLQQAAADEGPAPS